VVTRDPSTADAAASGWRASAREALAWLSIALGVVVVLLGIELWCGVAHLAGLYGHLGAGVLPACLAVWLLGASLLGAPLWWAGAPAWRRPGARRLLRWAGPLLLVLAVASLVSSHAAGGAASAAAGPDSIDDASVAKELARLAPVGRRAPRVSGLRPLASDTPVICAEPVDGAQLTLIATFIERRTLASTSRCFQGAELSTLVADAAAVLSRSVARAPLQLELVSGTRALTGRHAWLDAFKLRPGLDGVCWKTRCVLPWQLLARGAFSTYRPLSVIPDFQLGVDPGALRSLVQAPAEAGVAGLLRITTRSYALDLSAARPSLTALSRMRRREVPLEPRALTRAEKDAEAYVLAAQQPDGRFRYTLDPITASADTRGFNLARQAGTTLVLCELGRAPERDAAIARALAAFEPFVRTRGELAALSADPASPTARIGESALPLVSMLACADLAQAPLPAYAPGLARALLALQRDDGGFAPALDWMDGKPLVGPEPLYAAGQAVMALVLLEQRLATHPHGELPSYDEVHAAVERAMQYFATRYWSHPLRDFFFLEENWHCLAARAALGVHRHPGYEEFCLDYVRFKSRLILREEDGIAPDFDGGFGFGNLVPPHNTGAAGLGEALAAAISISSARGEATEARKQQLARVMRFLLRQQWSRDNCFACASSEVIGGMSEHTHSSLTRIDFAQHAWAALGHGWRALGGSRRER
jgi:hypothetical protein